MVFADANPYRSPHYTTAAMANESERTAFLRRTYAHLGGAIGAFVLLEFVIFNTVNVEALTQSMVSGWNWLIVLGLFMVASWVARGWATSATSLATQYLGLALYLVVEAIIFVPLLYFASWKGGASVIPTAGVITCIIFGGLTSMVFVTRADFSWLGRYLFLATLAAMGLIVCSVLFGGFNLGLLFSVAMVTIAAGYILYDTSNVLHHYRTDQHVAAALALFASVALLFWYVLQIVMRLQGRD